MKNGIKIIIAILLILIIAGGIIVLSKIFNNIRKTNNNVQAYMLVGEDKEKIEEYAILLSKILICPHVYEENCNKCNICKRIDENTFCSKIIP